MKAKLITAKKVIGFIPFEINIKVETIQDARLMFHLANNINLLKLINSDGSYNVGGEDYSNEDVSITIVSGFWEEIAMEIRGQGFDPYKEKANNGEKP